MKKQFVHFALLAMVLCASFGCSTSTAQKLNRLDLGMSQAQVKKILGDDYIAKASTTDNSGARLQMWEYTDKKTQEAYRVYFKDGQLAQWGTRGSLDFPTLNLPK
jgi:hypothetical protein